MHWQGKHRRVSKGNQKASERKSFCKMIELVKVQNFSFNAIRFIQKRREDLRLPSLHTNENTGLVSKLGPF